MDYIGEWDGMGGGSQYLMSKLFVVFCKELSQAPRVLKTKSYAKSLIKKNMTLGLQEFTNQKDAHLFISTLINSKTLTPTPTLETPSPIIPHTPPSITHAPLDLLDPPIHFTPILKLQDIQPPSSPPSQPIIQLPPTPISTLFRYFKPSATTSITPDSIIHSKIQQNQNPGLTQISHYFQNQQSPINTIFVGHKYKHHAQFLSAIYILQDLYCKGIRTANLSLSNPYVITLLQSFKTLDPLIDTYLVQYKKLTPHFDDIHFHLCQDLFPQRLKLAKFNFY